MPGYTGIARDQYGNSLSGAAITVYEDDGSTLATIYSDAEQATSLNNPFDSSNTGRYEFYAAPGFYNVQVSKPSYVTETLSDQLLGTVMCFADGEELGSKSSLGGTPSVISNTNLGAAHLVQRYSTGWSLNVSTGIWTYDGDAKILIEINASAVTTLSATGILILRCYRDKGGARELIMAQSQEEVGTTPNKGTVIYGVGEIEKGDTLGFYFNIGVGSRDVTMKDNSYYSIKAIG